MSGKITISGGMASKGIKSTKCYALAVEQEISPMKVPVFELP